MIDQETPPTGAAGERRGKHARASIRLRINLTSLCYLGELKTIKTAWEYYNEGIFVATLPYCV